MMRIRASRASSTLPAIPPISIPSGLHSSGLPMGVQLIARPFEEETLLRAGHALERALELPALRPTCA